MAVGALLYGGSPTNLMIFPPPVPSARPPALRRQLTRARAQVTPVEQSRRPRVVSLTALGQGSGVVVATALIADGGITTYALRLTLQEQRPRWLVSRVDEG